MPDVKEMLLKNAIDTVYSDTDEPNIDIQTVDHVNGQHQLNLTNWLVCSQYPAAGKEISPKNLTVILYVKRPNARKCWGT